MDYDDSYDEETVMQTNLAQGRYIVHPRGIKDHTFHEVQIDYQNA